MKQWNDQKKVNYEKEKDKTRVKKSEEKEKTAKKRIRKVT